MHIPVLLEPAIELLAPGPGMTAVDCTAGRGGHAEAIARHLGETGHLILFDLDPDNLRAAGERVSSLGPAVHAFPENYVHAERRLRTLGLRAHVLLADLGYASTQVDDDARGFSLRGDGPLDMRFDARGSGPARRTAADLIATMSERELADLIFQVGEDPFARRIARKIAAARQVAPISNTLELARLVTEAYGGRARDSRMHPATRTFMALRIAVNDELGALDGLLQSVGRGAAMAAGASPSDSWLEPDARIGIISFHSLEDRRVKQAFAGWEKEGLGVRTVRRPVQATETEVAANPRARSAKLRVMTLGAARTADRTA